MLQCWGIDPPSQLLFFAIMRYNALHTCHVKDGNIVLIATRYIKLL